jgi:hypothetical protein
MSTAAKLIFLTVRNSELQKWHNDTTFYKKIFKRIQKQSGGGGAQTHEYDTLTVLWDMTPRRLIWTNVSE